MGKNRRQNRGSFIASRCKSSSGRSNSRSNRKYKSAISRACKGQEWSHKLQLVTEASEADGSGDNCRYFTHDELMSGLKQYIEPEKILEVQLYKNPLTPLQLSYGDVYHMFIVIQTEKWWWSIEKNTQGITIQRSRSADHVTYRILQEKRPEGRVLKVTLIYKEPGRKQMHELIDWLYKQGELNRPYSLCQRNCKHFGRSVYNFVTPGKGFFLYEGINTYVNPVFRAVMEKVLPLTRRISMSLPTIPPYVEQLDEVCFLERLSLNFPIG